MIGLIRKLTGKQLDRQRLGRTRRQKESTKKREVLRRKEVNLLC